MNRLEQLRSLAETHLADFDLDEAVDALVEFDNIPPANLPDDLLVRVARRTLETIDELD